MSQPEEAVVYPLFLKLRGRDVVVICAGTVAAGKIARLVAAGARVRVVAPAAADDILAMAQAGTVEWHARPFEERDVDGAWLVIAATSDIDVQRRAAAAAEAHRVFIIAVDDPQNASAYSGAVLERPPFVVAISSSWATPALTRLLREILEQVLPSDDWVEHAKGIRARWLAEGTPMSDRFADLVKAFKQRAG